MDTTNPAVSREVVDSTLIHVLFIVLNVIDAIFAESLFLRAICISGSITSVSGIFFSLYVRPQQQSDWKRFWLTILVWVSTTICATFLVSMNNGYWEAMSQFFILLCGATMLRVLHMP